MICIDHDGKYYQDRKKHSNGDAMIEFPTAIMLEYLTPEHVTQPEFGLVVHEAQVQKHNLIETKEVETKEVEDIENL